MAVSFRSIVANAAITVWQAGGGVSVGVGIGLLISRSEHFKENESNLVEAAVLNIMVPVVLVGLASVAGYFTERCFARLEHPEGDLPTRLLSSPPVIPQDRLQRVEQAASSAL